MKSRPAVCYINSLFKFVDHNRQRDVSKQSYARNGVSSTPCCHKYGQLLTCIWSGCDQKLASGQSGMAAKRKTGATVQDKAMLLVLSCWVLFLTSNYKPVRDVQDLFFLFWSSWLPLTKPSSVSSPLPWCPWKLLSLVILSGCRSAGHSDAAPCQHFPLLLTSCARGLTLRTSTVPELVTPFLV